MKNAEWMIQNKYDFLKLDIGEISRQGYLVLCGILYDNKAIDSIWVSSRCSTANAILTWLDKEHEEHYKE